MVISRVISPLIWCISYTYSYPTSISPLITTPEPPSTQGMSLFASRPRLSRDLALTPLQCAADCGQLQARATNRAPLGGSWVVISRLTILIQPIFGDV